MFNITLHLAPSLLVLFMVALAIVPLGLIWADSRRREADQSRLTRLRQEATLRDALSRRAASALSRPASNQARRAASSKDRRGLRAKTPAGSP